MFRWGYCKTRRRPWFSDVGGVRAWKWRGNAKYLPNRLRGRGQWFPKIEGRGRGGLGEGRGEFSRV